VKIGLAYLSYADYEKAKGDFDTSLSLLLSVSSTNDNFKAGILYMRGKACRQLHKFADAVQDFSQAIELFHIIIQQAKSNSLVTPTLVTAANEKMANAHLERGIAHDRCGRLQEALQDYNQFLQLFQQNTAAANTTSNSNNTTNNNKPTPHTVFQAYYNRGLIHTELKQLEDAIQDFTQAVTHANSNYKEELADALYQRGRAFDLLSQKERAAIDYKQAVTVNAKHVRANYHLANVLYELRCYDDALEVFHKVVQHDAQDYTSIYNRGMCYKAQGEWVQAIEDFKHVAKIQKAYFKAYLQCARTLRKLQDEKNNHDDEEWNNLIVEQYNSAIKYIDDKQELPTLLFERGVVYNRMRNFEKAVADFTQCCNLDSKFVDALFNRGILFHHELQNYTAALEDYNSVLKLQPNDVECLINRGCLAYDMGDVQNARQDWLSALQLDPHNELANTLMQETK